MPTPLQERITENIKENQEARDREILTKIIQIIIDVINKPINYKWLTKEILKNNYGWISWGPIVEKYDYTYIYTWYDCHQDHLQSFLEKALKDPKVIALQPDIKRLNLEFEVTSITRPLENMGSFETDSKIMVKENILL